MASEVGPLPHIVDGGHLVAGRYRLVRRIATGAMGVVWEAHDERLDRRVAVKALFVQPGLGPEEAVERVARCLREGRIAARLNHPNAITVFDVVDEDGVPHLVMEFVPSRSLATVMAEEGPLPPDAVAVIGAQVASALAAAHAAGIVHRDITPGNVLLGEDGSAKLTDFGISRAVDDVAVTRTGVIAGTPAFLAPEVALGGDPTPASDVFSLGSTLYAATEGEPPFGTGENVLGVLHAVACGTINPPRRSGPLTGVLTALLNADPHARPTAATSRDLLTAAAEGRDPLAVADGPATPDHGLADEPTVVIRRSSTAPAAGAVRTPMAVVGVFVVALIAAGLWLLGSHDNVAPTHDRSPANGHSPTTGTSTTTPVAPVMGEPLGAADPPTTTPPPPRRPTTPQTAPTTTAGAPNPPPPPAPTTTPTTPPTTSPTPTTTGQAPPTTDATTTPPPSSGESSSTAPSSSSLTQ